MVTFSDNTSDRMAERWFEADHERFLLKERHAPTITSVKEDAKELSALTGEPLGRCLELIARRRANMNWHAYRLRLIRPLPFIQLDDVNYGISMALTPHPDEARFFREYDLRDTRNKAPTLGIPFVLVQRICTVTDDGVEQARPESIHCHVVLNRAFDEWVSETCSGAFRFFVYAKTYSALQRDAHIAVLRFKKETDRDLVRKRLIDKGLDQLTNQALRSFDEESLRLLHAIAQNEGVVRNAVREGWIGRLISEGFIHLVDVLRPVILSIVARRVILMLVKFGYNIDRFDHSADALLTRDDLLGKKTITAEMISFLMHNRETFPDAKARAVDAFAKTFEQTSM